MSELKHNVFRLWLDNKTKIIYTVAKLENVRKADGNYFSEDEISPFGVIYQEYAHPEYGKDSIEKINHLVNADAEMEEFGGAVNGKEFAWFLKMINGHIVGGWQGNASEYKKHFDQAKWEKNLKEIQTEPDKIKEAITVATNIIIKKPFENFNVGTALFTANAILMFNGIGIIYMNDEQSIFFKNKLNSSLSDDEKAKIIYKTLKGNIKKVKESK